MRAVKVSYLMARSSDTVTYNVNTNPILTHGVTPGSRGFLCVNEKIENAGRVALALVRSSRAACTHSVTDGCTRLVSLEVLKRQ